MGFSFGKLSGKWKKFKHNVLDKGSLSHNAAKLAFGKKKGTAIMDQAGLAAADIYTFGGASLAAGLGQQAEAKYKYKQAKKAQKKAYKAAKLAKKKGLASDTGYTIGAVPNVGPYKSSVGYAGLLGSAGGLTVLPSSGSKPASSGGFWGDALGVIDRGLDQFGGGGEYSPPEMLSGPEQEAQLVEESGAAPSNMPFLLIGGAALLLIAALSKR